MKKQEAICRVKNKKQEYAKVNEDYNFSLMNVCLLTTNIYMYKLEYSKLS